MWRTRWQISARTTAQLYVKLMAEIRLIRCFGQLDSLAQVVTHRDVNDIILHIGAEVTALSEKLGRCPDAGEPRGELLG